MRRCLLFLAALMATNSLPISAEVQNTSASIENNCIDDIDLDIDLELAAQRKKKCSDDVLACLKQTLSAKGGLSNNFSVNFEIFALYLLLC